MPLQVSLQRLAEPTTHLEALTRFVHQVDHRHDSNIDIVYVLIDPGFNFTKQDSQTLKGEEKRKQWLFSLDDIHYR